MKRTRLKQIRRSFWGNRSRFLAILFIVALGSGFMAGLAAASPDMLETADRYFDDCAWYDLRLRSTLGFTGEDTAAVAEAITARTVMEGRIVDLVIEDSRQAAHTVRVYAFPGGPGGSLLNKVILKEGRLPEAPNECVLQSTAGRYKDSALGIGDTLTISRENPDYETLVDAAAAETLTVVGLVESPMCISVVAESTNVGSGSISADVYVLEDYWSFDYATDLYITLRGASALDTFGEAYEQLAQEARDTLSLLADTRIPLRAEELRTPVEAELDSAEEGLALLRDAANLAAAVAADTKRAATDTAVLNTQMGTCFSATLGLEHLAKRLQNAAEQPPDFEEAVRAAENAIADAHEALKVLDDGRWIIDLRNDSQGYRSYSGNVDKVSALAKLFPAFFFLIALLVALTTVTRLIDEQRGQIGTLKALGFTENQILLEYLGCSLVSSVLGCALGFAVGFRLFPFAISSAYRMMFTMPETLTPFRSGIALWVAPVTVGSILLATVLSCRAEVRAVPAVLMTPKAPAPGKRIWLEHLPFIWNHLSFTRKVTCRNIFRYRKRLLMTVIGTAGCSALLLTGFGVRDAVNDIVGVQFGELYRYDLTVLTDSSKSAREDTALQSLLEDKDAFTAVLAYHEENGRVLYGGHSEEATISVPADSDALSDFLTLRERESGTAIALTNGGVVLTEKLCTILGIHVGDIVTIENTHGKPTELPVTGITENYLTSYAYLAPDTAAQAFSEGIDFNTYLCRFSEGSDPTSVTTATVSCTSVLTSLSSRSLKEAFSDSIRSIDGVILVLILAAGLLSAVVLFNLTNVNICERRKELATLEVLGFHDRERQRYIFRETNVLSFLGTLVGLPLGRLLCAYVVRTVEVDQVMFGRTVYAHSYLYALLISAFFTLIVNRLMRRPILGIDMVEAMKAND